MMISFNNKDSTLLGDFLLIIEKKYAYIGGGASGSKGLMKKYEKIYKDVWRYYGVTAPDRR